MKRSPGTSEEHTARRETCQSPLLQHSPPHAQLDQNRSGSARAAPAAHRSEAVSTSVTSSLLPEVPELPSLPARGGGTPGSTPAAPAPKRTAKQQSSQNGSGTCASPRTLLKGSSGGANQLVVPRQVTITFGSEAGCSASLAVAAKVVLPVAGSRSQAGTGTGSGTSPDTHCLLPHFSGVATPASSSARASTPSGSVGTATLSAVRRQPTPCGGTSPFSAVMCEQLSQALTTGSSTRPCGDSSGVGRRREPQRLEGPGVRQCHRKPTSHTSRGMDGSSGGDGSSNSISGSVNTADITSAPVSASPLRRETSGDSPLSLDNSTQSLPLSGPVSASPGTAATEQGGPRDVAKSGEPHRVPHVLPLWEIAGRGPAAPGAVVRARSVEAGATTDSFAAYVKHRQERDGDSGWNAQAAHNAASHCQREEGDRTGRKAPTGGDDAARTGIGPASPDDRRHSREACTPSLDTTPTPPTTAAVALEVSDDEDTKWEAAGAPVSVPELGSGHDSSRVTPVHTAASTSLNLLLNAHLLPSQQPTPTPHRPAFGDRVGHRTSALTSASQTPLDRGTRGFSMVGESLDSSRHSPFSHCGNGKAGERSAEDWWPPTRCVGASPSPRTQALNPSPTVSIRWEDTPLQSSTHQQQQQQYLARSQPSSPPHSTLAPGGEPWPRRHSRQLSHLHNSARARQGKQRFSLNPLSHDYPKSQQQQPRSPSSPPRHAPFTRTAAAVASGSDAAPSPAVTAAERAAGTPQRSGGRRPRNGSRDSPGAPPVLSVGSLGLRQSPRRVSGVAGERVSFSGERALLATSDWGRDGYTESWVEAAATTSVVEVIGAQEEAAAAAAPGDGEVGRGLSHVTCSADGHVDLLPTLAASGGARRRLTLSGSDISSFINPAVMVTVSDPTGCSAADVSSQAHQKDRKRLAHHAVGLRKPPKPF